MPPYFANEFGQRHFCGGDSSQLECGHSRLEILLRKFYSISRLALPISLYQASDVEGHRQSLPACSDSDCDLGVDEFIVLCPELARINKPRNGSLGAKVEKRRRVETKILKPQVKLDPKSLKTQLEDAFFKANPASLKRATEFVIERVTSNCVKHFRNKGRFEIRKSETIIFALVLSRVGNPRKKRFFVGFD